MLCCHGSTSRRIVVIVPVVVNLRTHHHGNKRTVYSILPVVPIGRQLAPRMPVGTASQDSTILDTVVTLTLARGVVVAPVIIPVVQVRSTCWWDSSSLFPNLAKAEGRCRSVREGGILQVGRREGPMTGTTHWPRTNKHYLTASSNGTPS